MAASTSSSTEARRLLPRLLEAVVADGVDGPLGRGRRAGPRGASSSTSPARRCGTRRHDRCAPPSSSPAGSSASGSATARRSCSRSSPRSGSPSPSRRSSRDFVRRSTRRSSSSTGTAVRRGGARRRRRSGALADAGVADHRPRRRRGDAARRRRDGRRGGRRHRHPGRLHGRRSRPGRRPSIRVLGGATPPPWSSHAPRSTRFADEVGAVQLAVATIGATGGRADRRRTVARRCRRSGPSSRSDLRHRRAAKRQASGDVLRRRDGHHVRVLRDPVRGARPAGRASGRDPWPAPRRARSRRARSSSAGRSRASCSARSR